LVNAALHFIKYCKLFYSYGNLTTNFDKALKSKAEVTDFQKLIDKYLAEKPFAITYIKKDERLALVLLVMDSAFCNVTVGAVDGVFSGIIIPFIAFVDSFPLRLGSFQVNRSKACAVGKCKVSNGSDRIGDSDGS